MNIIKVLADEGVPTGGRFVDASSSLPTLFAVRYGHGELRKEQLFGSIRPTLPAVPGGINFTVRVGPRSWPDS